MRGVKEFWVIFCLLVVSHFAAFAQRTPTLKSVYFNLYTDSLKPVLNYYVNVEGQTTDGRYLPLDTNDIFLTADWGEMWGNAWVIPKVFLDEKVTFTAVSKRNPALRAQITVWIQKGKDPEDTPGYEAPETPQRSDGNR